MDFANQISSNQAKIDELMSMQNELSKNEERLQSDYIDFIEQYISSLSLIDSECLIKVRRLSRERLVTSGAKGEGPD